MEYLEVETLMEDNPIDLAGRKLTHPLYKLYFRNRDPESAGAYMSLESDTFWPMDRISDYDPWYDHKDSNTFARRYRGASDEVASALKRVVGTFSTNSSFDHVAIVDRSQTSKTMTVLLDEKEFPIPTTYLLETDGVFDPNMAEAISEDVT
ncbi:hypothetical protein BDZ45DRAFT_31841 [Acephala macrosclerotiorum]|nr:hypothetical protein BDZ45DRAFT_31841 [Acephala macrosclerotiorum]